MKPTPDEEMVQAGEQLAHRISDSLEKHAAHTTFQVLVLGTLLWLIRLGTWLAVSHHRFDTSD